MSFYKQDPNNSKKQIPANNNRVMINKATAPAQLVIQGRPQQVIINQPGTYAFLYNTTASRGDSVVATVPVLAEFLTGSVVPGDADAGVPSVKLDISPVAWRQTDAGGTVGDVTFVYKGKYSQDGGPK